MKKVKLALLLSLVAMLIVVGSAFADGHIVVVNYDDTDSDFDTPASETPTSYILNGAFDDWTGGFPDNWTVWADDKSGWEAAHLAQTDLSFGGDGTNDGLGLFIRHTGGSGSYHAGAYQKLDLIPEAGYYFVNVSETIWYGVDTVPYNSVAWYAISDSESPSGVAADEWKELDPYTIQCPNDWELCDYAGRDETVWVEPGQYFHLKVAQKFPVMNSWTTFVIDDISIAPLEEDPENQENGFYDWVNDDPVDTKWHWYDNYACPTADCILTTVGWDSNAVR